MVSHGARATAELLKRFGLRPNKALGQHFLIDPNQVERIVSLSGVKAGDYVIEVGPGLGALTTGLLEAEAKVTAVEIDTELAEVLKSLFQHSVEIINQDALKVDWQRVANSDRRWSLIANLPYNVGTPLILDLLDTAPQIETFLIMVQREVAERMAASIGSKDYGFPSLKTQYWTHAKVVAKVPPTVFLPQPRVESALIRLDRRSERTQNHDAELANELFSLAKQAFEQRRKMIRKSLSGRVSEAQIETAGISPTQRPETVELGEWEQLARQVLQSKTKR